MQYWIKTKWRKLKLCPDYEFQKDTQYLAFMGVLWRRDHVICQEGIVYVHCPSGLTWYRIFTIQSQFIHHDLCLYCGTYDSKISVIWLCFIVVYSWWTCSHVLHGYLSHNTLRPTQHGCLLPSNILKWIFLNENIWISIKMTLKFVPSCPINNIPALVQIMAWCLDYWHIYASPGLNELNDWVSFIQNIILFSNVIPYE